MNSENTSDKIIVGLMTVAFVLLIAGTVSFGVMAMEAVKAGENYDALTLFVMTAFTFIPIPSVAQTGLILSRIVDKINYKGQLP